MGALTASLLKALVSLLLIWLLPYRVSRTLLFLLFKLVALGATNRTFIIIIIIHMFKSMITDF